DATGAPATGRGRAGRGAEGGAGSGVLRPRLVTDGPGRSGTPPARHYDLAARSSLHGSGGNAGEGSAAPDPKSPRWSAERRARPAGRAPRLARHGTSRAETRDNLILRLSALRLPLIGVDGTEEKQNPGAQTRRGNEGSCVMTGYELGPREATSVPPHPEEAAKPPSRRMGGHRSRIYPRSATSSAVPLMLRDAHRSQACPGC